MYTQKDTPNHRAPLVNVETTSPLQLVCMDYLTHIIIHQHILIITDHCTDLHRPFRHEIRQHEQLLKSCTTTVLYIMLPKTTFKEKTSNPMSLRNCVAHCQLPYRGQWHVLEIQPHTAQYVLDFDN